MNNQKETLTMPREICISLLSRNQALCSKRSFCYLLQISKLALVLLAALALLSACSGEPETGNGSGNSSSSAASSSSSSSNSSSSSSSSASSSSTSSSSGAVTSKGDPIAGKEKINACGQICHTDKEDGTFSGTSPFDINGLLHTDAQSASELSTYITQFMPKNNATQCTGNCADDIAAYLWTYKQQDAALDCRDEADKVLFASRALPLLTPEQYKNSIRDLFLSVSDNARVPDNLLIAPSTNKTGGFPNTNNQLVNDGDGTRYFNNATAIAEWNRSNNHLRCRDNNTEACARDFVEGFAEMAFRRPLTGDRNIATTEVGSFYQIFKDAPTAEDGMYWAVVGALTSPHFLYRSEIGIPVAEALNSPLFDTQNSYLRDKLERLSSDREAYVLTPYEFASSISYLITGSTPDERLMEAAANGELDTTQGLQRQIDRLLTSKAAERQMKHFVKLWLKTNVEQNTDLKALNENLGQFMLEELQTFFWHIFSRDDVPFTDFYSANYTFVNKALADHYGLRWPGAEAHRFERITMPEESRRGGVPTMGAFLASFSHGDSSAPILRAAHIREDMLCHHIPPPGTLEEEPGLRSEKAALAEAAKAERTLTTRGFYEISTLSNGPTDGCGTCHFYDINPLGATLEDFDGLGRYRTEQFAVGTAEDGLGPNPVPIDAVGALWGVENYKAYDEVVDNINGGRELSLALAETEAVKRCFVEKSLRLALNRPIKNSAQDLLNPDDDKRLAEHEAKAFACAEDTLLQALDASNADAKALFNTLINLDLMRFRR